MGTPKYAQQKTKFTPQEIQMSPGTPAKQRFNEEWTPSRTTRGSSVWVIDFFETPDQLGEGFEESGKEFGTNRRASKVARRLPGDKRVGRLEESLYWLFSAAMLSYLLLEIIGR